jgi:death-on-curing protein
LAVVEHGGHGGVRDKSALGRPLNHIAYASSDIIELAAKYTAADIVQNHPFVDGNKRTSFVIGVLFLELNGYRFTGARGGCGTSDARAGGRRMDEKRVLRLSSGQCGPTKIEVVGHLDQWFRQRSDESVLAVRV